jgi:shikimate dehydrogenase
MAVAETETHRMIKGSTQLVAIVGSPIGQVKSPENFNRYFESAGQDMAMVPMDVCAEDVASCVALMRGWKNLRGCVVTVPYKQAFAELVDTLRDSLHESLCDVL